MVQKKSHIPPMEWVNASENRECEDNEQIDERKKEDTGMKDVVQTELYCKR